MKKLGLCYIFLQVSHNLLYSQAVGIGDVVFTPNYLLHIHQNAASGVVAQFTNTSTGNATTDGFQINLNGNDIELINRENAELRLFTNNTQYVTISNTGNVGIDALTPNSKLHVNNGSLRISGSSNTNTEQGGMLIFDNTNGLGAGTARKVEVFVTTNTNATSGVIFEDFACQMRIDRNVNNAFIQLSPKAGYTENYSYGRVDGTGSANVNAATAGTFYNVSTNIRVNHAGIGWVVSRRDGTSPMYVITGIRCSLNGDPTEHLKLTIQAYYP